MTRFSNGFYTFSDSYLKSMKRLLAEERNKAIDEFAERIKEVYPFTILELEQLDEIAKEMRGAE